MRIWVFIISLTLVAGISLLVVPVHFDEAQYTTWLAHPDLSYQTKGPFVTYIQSLTHKQEFFPQLLQVRLPGWIAWGLSALLMIWLGKLAGFDRESSRRLLILFVTSPILLTIGMVHTTDIWLLFFMLLAFCAFASILHCRPNQHTELWWLVFGASLGLGALAKLSIALVPLSILPWVFVRSPRLIFTPGPFLGGLLCVFIMTPWILWNIDNDFAHLAHEFGHIATGQYGLMQSITWIPLILIASVPVMLLSLFGSFRLKVDNYVSEAEETVCDMLKFSFAGLLVFFVIKGFLGEVVLNWALPVVPFVLIVFASRMRWSPQNVLLAGFSQMVLLIVLIYPYALGLGIKQDPFQKIRGWENTIQEVVKISGPTEVVTSDHYSILAWALYFWPSESNGVTRYGSPVGQVIPSTTRRRNQYDNWNVLNREHSSLIHLGQYSEGLAKRCLKLNNLGDVSQVMPDGTVRSTLGVYRCVRFIPNPDWPIIDSH